MNSSSTAARRRKVSNSGRCHGFGQASEPSSGQDRQYAVGPGGYPQTSEVHHVERLAGIIDRCDSLAVDPHVRHDASNSRPSPSIDSAEALVDPASPGQGDQARTLEADEAAPKIYQVKNRAGSRRRQRHQREVSPARAWSHSRFLVREAVNDEGLAGVLAVQHEIADQATKAVSARRLPLANQRSAVCSLDQLDQGPPLQPIQRRAPVLDALRANGANGVKLAVQRSDERQELEGECHDDR